MSLYSSKPIEISIPQGCPWHEAQVTFGTPNVDWCEPTICAYVNEPANTWSNLPFLLIALLVWRQFKAPQVRGFAAVVFLMGTLSGIYHATNNLLTQHFDFIGMALMTSYLLAFIAGRILKSKSETFGRNFWFFMTISLGLLLFLGVLKLPMQMFMLISGAGIILGEMYCYFVLRNSHRIFYFVVSLSILVVAQVSAQIDLKRIWCEPDNIVLHGHVFWHVLCAVAMYFAARYIQENTSQKR